MSTPARSIWWTPQARPLRISALMDLYERNFRLVQRLLPELELPFDDAVSRSRTDLPLRLTVIERGRYTAAFRLTYEFAEGDVRAMEPDLRVRVYRDAQLAEALNRPQRPHWLAAEEGDPAAMQYLDEQWSRNLLLNKWLTYLLEHGHGFGMAARPRLHAVPA
ncbi:MAG TPA: DUF1249 domain-containing protein [Candidatus Binatia bacterium]|nr:DUF1249 domain-containing protein [Candidatus Binatia bacterium]